MSRIKTVTAKLANMRKPQEFVVYPREAGEPVVVQSGKSIGRFDPTTGEGVLNTKGCYFPHLSKALGAQPYTFPQDFVTACIAAYPLPGDEIGPGVYVA